MLYPIGGRVRRRRRHRSVVWDSPDRGGFMRLSWLVRAEEERAAVKERERRVDCCHLLPARRFMSSL